MTVRILETGSEKMCTYLEDILVFSSLLNVNTLLTYM